MSRTYFSSRLCEARDTVTLFLVAIFASLLSSALIVIAAASAVAPSRSLLFRTAAKRTIVNYKKYHRISKTGQHNVGLQ